MRILEVLHPITLLFCGVLYAVISEPQIQQTQVCFSGQECAKRQDEESAIPWSNQRLTFGNFSGSIDSSSEHAANSQAGIRLDVEASNDLKAVHIAVAAIFYPDSSWLKVHNEDLLTHEQGHFDLCEVYARKIRRQISTINSRDYATVSQTVVEIYTSFRDQETNAHQKYDVETAHGINRAEQQRWDKRIAAQLRENERYMDTKFNLPVTVRR